jgi:hypothetical protein
MVDSFIDVGVTLPTRGADVPETAVCGLTCNGARSSDRVEEIVAGAVCDADTGDTDVGPTASICDSCSTISLLFAADVRTFAGGIKPLRCAKREK